MKFYAVGKAGKYLIQNPDPLYETVFNQMRETASMFDFIETKLRKMRKKTSDMSDSNMNNYAQRTFIEVGLSVHGNGVLLTKICVLYSI